MKYRLIELEAVDPDEFAAQHGLEMVVREDADSGSGYMFSAAFSLTGSDAWLLVVSKEGIAQPFMVGIERSPEKAVAAYLTMIRGHLLRTHRAAEAHEERYIQCPAKWRLA